MEINKYILDFTFATDYRSYEVHETIYVHNSNNNNNNNKQKKLVLNGENLSVESIKINNEIYDEYRIINNELLEISIESIVEIDFKVDVLYRVDKFGEGLDALYRASFNNDFMITSHFEPISARKCFYCIDEPNKKSIFKVILNIPDERECISNMNLEKKINSTNGYTRYEFFDTPKMSTYLLYIGVGKFSSYSTLYDSRVKVSAIGLKEEITEDNSKNAIEVACSVLEYFEEYFGIRYPLDKLDLIAVPEFSAGAMENWGAITFRSKYIVNTKSTTSMDLKRSTIVIAHEIAHQWFGNLVTLKYWNYIWLNESFATFLAYKYVYNKERSNEVYFDYIFNETKNAFIRDSINTSHPIELDGTLEGEKIYEAFDSISYSKGGSVLRYIEYILGEENFRSGVCEYLNKYMYSNTTSSDFLNVLFKNNDSDSYNSLASYINITGFPVIKYEYSASTMELKIEQSEYLSGEESNRYIALNIKYKDGSNEKISFNGSVCVITLDKEFDYIYSDSFYGYYVIKHTGEQIENIIMNDRNDFNISKLIFDVYMIASRGDLENINLTDFFSLLKEKFSVTNKLTNEFVIAELSSIYAMTRNKSILEMLKSVCDIVDKGEKNIGDTTYQYATDILSYISDEWRDSILERYTKLDEVDANLRKQYIRSYLINSMNEDEKYSKYIKLVNECKSEEDMLIIASNIFVFETDEMLNNLLYDAVKKRVKKQNIVIFITNFVNGGYIFNPKCLRSFEKFLINNFEYIVESQNIKNISNIITRVMPVLKLNDLNSFEEYIKAFNVRRNMLYSTAIQSSMEDIKQRNHVIMYTK